MGSGATEKKASLVNRSQAAYGKPSIITVLIATVLSLTACSQYPNQDWSEYWKSQPKKYCEYCKCWITDNKPSVQFHEKGKNHQENVRRKIDELKKKGIEDAQRKEELESDIQRMEQAALEAFKKDLANDPALAAKYGVVIKTKEEKEREQREKEREKREKEEAKRLKEEEERIERETVGIWYEAKSPQGYSYYWNTLTNESVWVAPEKYVSLEEQNAEAAEEPVKDESTEETKESTNTQETQAQETNDDENVTPGIVEGPLPRVKTSAYGSWEKLKEVEDLQLPKVEEEPVEPIPVEEIPLPAPPKEKKESGRFKEKCVKTLANANDSQNVAFKKRKIARSARQTRQRDEDDDD